MESSQFFIHLPEKNTQIFVTTLKNEMVWFPVKTTSLHYQDAFPN